MKTLAMILALTFAAPVAFVGCDRTVEEHSKTTETGNGTATKTEKKTTTETPNGDVTVHKEEHKTVETH